MVSTSHASVWKWIQKCRPKTASSKKRNISEYIIDETAGGTRYPQTCKFLKLEHHIHSPYEKILIERTMQFVKDRTESFDDYFPFKKLRCRLKHINKWFDLFIDHHNKEIMS